MKEIFFHELFDNIKSARFIMMLLFSVTLFSLNGFIYVRKLEGLQDEYNRLAPKYNSWKSTVSTMACKPPSPRMFIAEGGEKYLSDSFRRLPR